MKKLLVLFLIFSPALGFLNAKSMIINYYGYNNLSIYHYGSSKLVNISQYIYLYPQDDEIINKSFFNLGVDDKRFYYSREGDFSKDRWFFNITIKSNRKINFIKNNPSFPYPVSFFPINVREYLKFDDIINNDSNLKKIADNVVKDATDYLTAIQLLSQKVKEMINYSFTEPYISDTLSASQTLLSKKGVCDEFAVLLMSLAREENIPARYVSGYAYGSLLGLSDFGPHAWVELYVPDYGWLAVDPTYGEYGWIDASHVAMVKEENISHSFISTISIIGGNANEIKIVNNLPDYLKASFGSQTSGFNILSRINETFILTADVNVNKNSLGEGEYFLLNVSINNPTDYFIPLSYEISTTRSMRLINASHWRSVLLLPHSSISSYTILQTPYLNFHAIHPISVYVPLAGKYNTQVDVSPFRKNSTSLQELLFEINQDKKVKSKVKILNLSISPSIVYDNETNISFLLLNNENHTIHNVKINVFGDLIKPENRIINVLNQNKIINMNIPIIINSKGNSKIKIYISYDDFLSKREISFISAENPNLKLYYEGNHTFKQDPHFIVKIINNLKVNVPLLNLTIITPLKNITKQFTPNDIPEYLINVSFPKNFLNYGDNNVEFVANYVDNYGKKFESDLSVNIKKQGQWWEYIVDLLNNMFIGIINIFK